MVDRAPLWILLLAATSLASCARSGSSSAALASSAATSTSAAPEAISPNSPMQPAPTAIEPELPAPVAGPWRESIRLGKLREAATSLDALDESERTRADMRLLRAKLASQLGDHQTTVKQLDGLELPLVAARIEKLRAESALEVGPYELAASYYAAGTNARALSLAALAFERAGRPDDARRALDKAIAQAKGSAEVRARAQRMRLAEVAGARDAAVTDARWIFLRAPESAESKAALDVLSRLDASWHPTVAERLTRLDKLAASGKTSEARAEIAALWAMRGKGKDADPQKLLRAKGNALYKLRQYAEAAETLAQVARNKGTAEDEFLAARALSRANRDDEAIRAYRALIKRYPKSAQADEAAFLTARLLMLTGKLDEAAVAYGKYLKTGRKNRQIAALELSLVQMSQKQYSRARAGFAGLARAERNGAEAARLRELEGLAALRAGDVEGAKSLFIDVIRAQPLSWPALLAQARLTQLKAPLPPLIEPAEGSALAPLSVKLPKESEFLHSIGLEEDAEDALRSYERELLLSHGSRGYEAQCAAYGQLEIATRRYRIGQDHAKLELVMKAPGDANRWAWDCLYPRPYEALVQDAEARQELPRGLVHAIMRQESGFAPEVVSPALAVGLLQLLPQTARELSSRAGLDFEDGSLVRPAVNIELGSRYLAMLLKMWKGNLPLAIASYNAGPNAISRWLEHAGSTDIELFVARIPYAETRGYVSRVMGNLARYAYLEGGASALPPLSLEIDTSMRATHDAFLACSMAPRAMRVGKSA